MRHKIISIYFFLWLSTALVAQPQPGANCTDEYFPLLAGKRVALVVNHTSLVDTVHLADTLLHAGINVQLIYAPEHGFRGDANAGVHIADTTDPKTGIPVRSLYGKSKKPSKQQLDSIDIVLFDIQDVGARFYTYISTLFYVAEACAEQKVPLLVLDRPNPNGHYVDGPVLESPYRSFVGIAALPVVHGCSVGELARMYRGEHWIQQADSLELRVVPAVFYRHSAQYILPVRPSPNLPDFRSVLLYPSVCLLEGTKVSVGRGTDAPFQWVGYPDYPAGDTVFTPVPNAGSSKPPYENQLCTGYHLSRIPTDSLFLQSEIDLELVIEFFKNSPRKDDFFLKNGFFNLLSGNNTLRVQIEQGNTAEEIRASWQPALAKYKAMRRQYLLYPE